MSRNLAVSGCCGMTVRLSDLRGKPIEFRRYYSYAPTLGTKWVCPKCDTEYFAIWREYDARECPPKGQFVIDLSYYESYNDEHGDPLQPGQEPAYLCTDDAEDAQWHWGFTSPEEGKE